MAIVRTVYLHIYLFDIFVTFVKKPTRLRYRVFGVFVEQANKANALSNILSTHDAFLAKYSKYYSHMKCHNKTLMFLLFQGDQNNHQIKIEVSDTDVTNTGETARIEYISSQQTPTSTIHKDNQDNSAELQRVKNQMDQTLKILETVFQNRNDEDDECNIFGKLVAIKLRKLPEDRRDIMMFKINELLYGESQSYKRPRPPSSSGP